MQHRTTVRVTASAAAAVAAALSLTACRPGDGGGASGAPAKTPTTATARATASHPATPAAETSRPATGGGSAHTGAPATSAPASAGSGAPGGTVPACAATALEASAYQAADRPSGTGVGSAVIQFANTSGKACTLEGHPTVAGAGNGSPQHNRPLTVTPTGTAASVRVAPGGKAWVKLTFVQVQGEGDGYCVSGAKPVAYPTLVVGLPGAGAHQVALSDGLFAECDNKVTATAVTAVRPS
ncbi:DUF4232 domain-containing protein [Streptomyces collinus]|uniref:DUF4232 domain-containing protein n=1 Tax=Streptomyces collinus (strain DSM 40733 / Tue 365) TaxID=1214242 RepID=S5UWU1_STRC3|nr:DUF4232 domain-containing protein [Streptomyces collinus]AGS67499.1 hypothetical protein B446_03335 [Streptomyces collinus Tu 365]UJA06179.1 hypothetical protein HGI10_00580 [Streptomyces collinus]UJA12651.1 hypothetical protein HGI10_66360 [Streptomyces collinus]